MTQLVKPRAALFFGIQLTFPADAPCSGHWRVRSEEGFLVPLNALENFCIVSEIYQVLALPYLYFSWMTNKVNVMTIYNQEHFGIMNDKCFG